MIWGAKRDHARTEAIRRAILDKLAIADKTAEDLRELVRGDNEDGRTA